jgi:hypothetical protein
MKIRVLHTAIHISGSNNIYTSQLICKTLGIAKVEPLQNRTWNSQATANPSCGQGPLLA